MESRVNKYGESENMSRVKKNEELYKEINNDELDSFSLRSNATVIGTQDQEIDIEKIKKILDKRYNDAPKRKSIRVEPREEVNSITEEPTKEYDLNLVLEKAKDEKEESYEENRAKKLRNTQFDILSNLNIEKKEENNKVSAEEELKELINTITLNESKKKEMDALKEDSDIDPLSILEDLRGDDNTQVYESMATEVTKITEIREKEPILEEEKSNTEEEVKEETTENSFITKNMFKKKDFEDEDDFADDDKMDLWVKILIALVIIAFAVGLFIFLKSFLKF